MSKQVKKDSEPRTRIPDKDQYTAGGPRPRPQTRPNVPHADNPPKRGETLRKEEKEDEDHEESVMNAGKWKPEDEPPYAKTYAKPLDEDGEPE